MGLIAPPRAVQETCLWQFAHALFFLIGGITFIFGTACYYFPDWPESYLAGGVLYTIGSCGFLGVDVMELFTYTSNTILTLNIFMSATGSFLYVVGSIGFIPAVYESTGWNFAGFTPATTGVYGFIAGSQFGKVGRIMTTTKDITAVGVELNPGLGAWCFFVGTMMYNNPYYLEHYYGIIVNIWEVGSVLFTMGALFLTFRHFVMGVA
jgi:hypothetical protein